MENAQPYDLFQGPKCNVLWSLNTAIFFHSSATVMALNAPYRLPEAPPPAVPVYRPAESLLVEDHACDFRRIAAQCRYQQWWMFVFWIVTFVSSPKMISKYVGSTCLSCSLSNIRVFSSFLLKPGCKSLINNIFHFLGVCLCEILFSDSSRQFDWFKHWFFYNRQS